MHQYDFTKTTTTTATGVANTEDNINLSQKVRDTISIHQVAGDGRNNYKHPRYWEDLLKDVPEKATTVLTERSG
jgi:hypothetical protein